MKLTFNNNDFLGMAATSKRLNISRMTLHRWIASGKIKAVQIGRYRYISKSEIERLNSDQATKANG